MLKLDLKGKEWKSYGNTGTPITMDMGGFYCYYRNNLGGARTAFFKVSDHNEARDETSICMVVRLTYPH